MVAVVAGILAISKFYQQRWWLQILQRMSASTRSKLYLWYRVTRLEMKPILRREQTKTAKSSADISQSSNNRVSQIKCSW